MLLKGAFQGPPLVFGQTPPTTDNNAGQPLNVTVYQEQEMLDTHKGDVGIPQDELTDEALLESMDGSRFWQQGQQRAGEGGFTFQHK